MTAEAKGRGAMDVQPVMTPTQVMEWLQIKRTKLYDLIDQGLPYHSLSPKGRTKVFYPSEVQAWLDARGQTRIRSSNEPEPASPRTAASELEALTRKWVKPIPR